MNAVRATKMVRPTIRLIAQQAGVSRQTVSNVLNYPQRVAPATRDKVLQAIEVLGYRPNETARSLARSRSHLVGIHVSDGQHNEASILDPFMRELARLGEPLGYRLVLSYSPPDYASQIDSYTELLARQAVDAMVIAQTSAVDTRPAWLLEHHLPFVAFGRPWLDQPCEHSWVDVDGAYGLGQAVRHLQDLGHTRIAHVGCPPDRGTMDDRAQGWMRAAHAPLGFDIRLTDLLVRVPYGEVIPAVTRLMREHAPTAITCSDDLYARGAMAALADLGLRPGADVAVIGYDDSYIARLARPGLTSIKQPLTRLAQLVWQSLIAQLADRDEPPLQRLVPPELVVRESSGPPR